MSSTPHRRALAALLLLLLSAPWSAFGGGHNVSGNSTAASTANPAARDLRAEAAAQAERSREAGLLTDWHLVGCYGHSGTDFTRSFEPEHWSGNDRHVRNVSYELLFPEGTFALPAEMAGQSGVFYALARVYLSGSGDWNLYLESGAEAVVFVDGRQVLERGANHRGTLRETIHAESGFHDVLVKFVAQAAPFRLAVLPPNSGSRRKNNTPYLQGPEDLSAQLHSLKPELKGTQGPRAYSRSGPSQRYQPAQTASSKESTPLRLVSSANFSARWLSVAKTSLARRT